MHMVVKFAVILGAAFAGAAVLERYPGALNDPTAIFVISAIVILGAALVFGAGSRGTSPVRVFAGAVAVIAVAVGVVGVFDANQEPLRRSALRALSSLQPGYPVALSATETVLTRERSGHFTAIAMINGAPVHMLVDTGSTDVALPYVEARRIGIDVGDLVFSRPVVTANGRAMVAPVMLSEVTIGAVKMTNVRASVAEPGRLHGALLGMSFLGRLSEISVRGETLVMTE